MAVGDWPPPVVRAAAVRTPLNGARDRPKRSKDPAEAGHARVTMRSMSADDVDSVIALQRRVYTTIPAWRPDRLHEQLQNFPQGQVIAESGGRLVGYAGSLVVLWDEWSDVHSWSEITSDGRFDHHNPQGRTLYGAEVFVAPEARGLGVGHRLYEARRKLCRVMNLKRIIACGRLPGYAAHASLMSAEGYAQRVVWGDLNDPVLGFQLHEGFRYCGVVPGYLPEDGESRGHASLIVWLNPDYDPRKGTRIPRRIAL